MALGKIRHRKSSFVMPRLMITSMMDMFTIILIFLLFSFSDKQEHLILEEDLNLPKSTIKADYTDSIKLVLSQNSLKLGEELLAPIKNGRIIGLDPKNPQGSLLFRRLQEAYEKARMEDEGLAQENETKKNHILFLCDKNHSFKTINEIIKTAGMAGYPNFQFAVLKQ